MTIREQARSEVEALRPELVALSRFIHANPELGWQEHEAVAAIGEILDRHGLSIRAGAFDLATAFEVEFGPGPTTVAICAEYDALPDVSHACGHNVIAASSIGAALALLPLTEAAGLRVRLLGTPAEEVGNGAGKDLMLERGAFGGVDAAMMVHPAPFDVLMPMMIAAATFDVSYTGKEAHAAFYPELGINAADGFLVAQTALNALRQHIRATDRIHGIVTSAGAAANIVPAHATGRFMARSRTIDDLERLRERVVACFGAGALATGSTLSLQGGDRPYADVRHDVALAELFGANMRELGRPYAGGPGDVERPSGSTDMGNVSQVVPSIHPFIGIGSFPAVNHQPEFAAACISESADQAIVDAAVAMAWTAIDLAAQRAAA